VRQQLIRAEGVSRLQHHARHDQLAPFGIGDTEHRRLADCWVVVDHGFDFAGVDVLAAGHDHVLQSIEDVEVPVGILIAGVAGANNRLGNARALSAGLFQ